MKWQQWFTEINNWSTDNIWIIQVFLVVFVVLAVNLLQRRIINNVIARLRKTPNPWDDALVSALHKPLTLLIWIVGLAFATEIAGKETGASIFDAVGPVRDIGVIVSICWFLVRLIRNSQDNIIEKQISESDDFDRTSVDAISKLLKASVAITGVLVALQTLGFSISGVLAFGGVGGIAIGFAAKDLLANFFGGLMIYLDRPFSVGDWIRSPDREIEGTVERIGWRLTVIRTFDKRPVYVPNATFANIAVENPSRMSNRRIYETIGVRYDDIDKLPKIVADVEAMLKSHADIDADKTLMVNFNSFSASSLDFFVYTFTHTTVWTEFHKIKQDILFQIGQIISEHGAEIAFPTSTVHLPDYSPLVSDASKTQEK